MEGEGSQETNKKKKRVCFRRVFLRKLNFPLLEERVLLSFSMCILNLPSHGAYVLVCLFTSQTRTH